MTAITRIVSRFATVFVLTGCALNSAPDMSSSPDKVESTSSELTVSPIGGGRGCLGVGTVVCINGGHWDPKLCRCVPGCVDNVLCIQGTHFDSVQCKCVPNACISDEDGPCGGFTQNPCRCGSGLVCVPNRTPDVPGTCEPQRCCPVGWNMYSCSEEDGSSGLNCHNPQLACASSQMCGGGCDFQVTGRCPVCDPIVCPSGEVFDPTSCGCVAGCTSAADCSGPLPQLCEVCSDGSTACAHFACVAGQCQVAICP